MQRWIASLAGRLPTSGWRTRFAPAPTGVLHLGHVVNALHVWGLARVYGGRVLLRIENHDRTRCTRTHESGILDDLDWLGFVPDEGDTQQFRTGPTRLRQSDNTEAYVQALAQLEAAGIVYVCPCSRRDIAAVVGESAPGEELRYPGTCRDRALDPTRTVARRVCISDTEETFDDLRLGTQRQQPATQCGDVLVRDRHGHWTYQFAVVVDDFAQQIAVVIRGEDLLASTGRQLAIARLLQRTSPPLFLHHALLRHSDGRKLSKAASDTGIRDLRADGWSAARVIGEAAALSGLQPTSRPVSANDVAQLFA